MTPKLRAERARPAGRAAAAALVLGTALYAWLAREPEGGPARALIGAWTPGRFALGAALAWTALWAVAAHVARASGRVLARGALASLGLALAWGALELSSWLGIVDYSAVLGMPESLRFVRVKPWNNPSNLRDETLLFRHRPHTGFQGRVPGDLVLLYGIATERRYPVDVRYDERGFRNPPGLERAELVLVGDSFIEAGLVPADGLASTLLAELTGRTTANLGHSGYGPQQELEVLRRYGLPLQPELVVWFFFEGNDLVDLVRYEAARSDPAMLDPEVTPYAFRSFTGNLVARLAESTRRARRTDSEEARRRSGMPPAPPGGIAERQYFAYPGLPFGKLELERLDAAQAVIREARAACRGRGAELLLVFVPTKFRVYAELCEFPPDGLAAGWRVNFLPESVRRFAVKESMPFLDLTPALQEAARAGEAVHFPDDGHWSPAGHAVVAAAVAGAVEALLGP